MSKRLQIETLKGWIARTPEGRKELTRKYQSVKTDQKQQRRKEHENYLKMIGKL